MSRKSTEINIEEAKSTKSEKLLAVVLTIFLCIGSLWTYTQIATFSKQASEKKLNALNESRYTNPKVRKHQNAENKLQTAEDRLQDSKEQLELQREKYRTAIEAKEPSEKLKASYEQSEKAYQTKTLQVKEAKQEVQKTAPAAKAAEKTLDQKDHELEKLIDRDSRITLILRLVFVIFTLSFTLWFLGYVRKQKPKFLALAISLVAASSLQALVMAWEYLGDYIQLQDVGPLVISLIGSAATILAFISLQRYLARRIPLRRVRRHECNFCGFPLKENPFCEGCGRHAFSDCTICHQKRRVGSTYCMSCGKR